MSLCKRSFCYISLAPEVNILVIEGPRMVETYLLLTVEAVHACQNFKDLVIYLWNNEILKKMCGFFFIEFNHCIPVLKCLNVC